MEYMYFFEFNYRIPSKLVYFLESRRHLWFLCDFTAVATIVVRCSKSDSAIPTRITLHFKRCYI